MKQKIKIKILRKVLVLSFLIVSLIIVGANQGNSVNAGTCDEAFLDFINEDNAYEIARYSYFYGIPTTCSQDCQGSSNPNQCEYEC